MEEPGRPTLRLPASPHADTCCTREAGREEKGGRRARAELSFFLSLSYVHSRYLSSFEHQPEAPQHHVTADHPQDTSRSPTFGVCM